MFRHSIVACARWESHYIGEWIRYYDLLGFDRIYLYCNDDDPSELAAQVAATPARAGLVQFTHFAGQGQQLAMYLDAMHRVRAESEWVTFLDIDEFLVLRGCDSIQTFMQDRAEQADSIHVNWLFFGNSGWVERPPGSVLRNYTQRAPSPSINTKHLTRTAALTDARLRAATFPFWHGLPDPVWHGLRRRNVIGADMVPLLAHYPSGPEAYLADPVVQEAILQTAVVNHYAMKSEADFLIRAARGTGGEFVGQSVWERQYRDGSFRTALDEMRGTEDTYLARLSESRLPEIKRADVAPVCRVRVQHRLWTDDLLLGPGGRLRHAGHGTEASYYQSGDLLHVRWDDYPDDVFMRRGETWVHAGPSHDSLVNLRTQLLADLDPVQAPIAAVLLQVPGSGHAVEVRPASSDVDVFRSVFVAGEYARPDLGPGVRTVIDLGANAGMSTVFFAQRYPGAQVIALEPEPGNFRQLQRNTRGLPNAVPVHAAVWHSDMRLDLRTVDDAGHPLGDWGVQTTQGGGDGGVAGLSIPTLLARYAIGTIDLLKVDIEGAELELFEPGCEAWLPRVGCVVVETHERFRPGSDGTVTQALAELFVEQEPCGENRIFLRRT